VDLIREIGYAEHAAQITEGLLDEYIRAHPDLLDIWVQYSEDQRCSPAWVLSGRDTVGDPTKDWHVSYWDHDPAKRSDQVFPDQFAACAFFVKRRADSLMRNAMTHRGQSQRGKRREL
jgi:hypothetical protein